MSRQTDLPRRLATRGATALFGLTTVFLLLYGIPRNFAERMCIHADSPCARQLGVETGLLRPDGTTVPIWERYVDFVGGLFTLDLGRSWIVDRGATVTDLLASHAPTTLWLVTWTALVVAAVGVPLGVYAGARGGSWRGRLAAGLGALQGCAPAFWLAVVVGGAFSAGSALSLYPAFGADDAATTLGDAFAGIAPLHAVGLEWAWLPVPDPVPFLQSVAWVLPAAVVLASAGIAVASRTGRGATREGRRSDYADLARSKGVPEREVLQRHVRPNATGPLVQELVPTGTALLAGVVLVEPILGIDGLGSLWIEAAHSADLDLLGATTAAFVLAAAALRVLGDLLGARTGPRPDRRPGKKRARESADRGAWPRYGGIA